MPATVLITSFGPFGSFEQNPSQRVMEHLREQNPFEGLLDLQWEVLPVSYQAVDDFMERLSPPDWAFHLGVATGSGRMRLELRGQNWVSGRDVDGADPSGQRIDEDAEDRNTRIPLSTLKEFQERHAELIELSQDAGTYLCNFLFFKQLASPDTRSLFVHIADVDHAEGAPSIEQQARMVSDLIQNLVLGPR